MKSQPKLLSSSTLSGDKVVNSRGEDLGKVEDFMIDLDTGEVGYAVLSFGGILGLGNKLFAVPWDALKVDTARKCFVMNVSKETLEQAPGFAKENWPDFADPSWTNLIRNYYPSRSAWTDITT